MKKLNLTSIVLTAVFVSIFAVTGCSGSGGGAVAGGTEITNDSGGITDGSGISSNPDITVQKGNIVVNVDNGNITIGGENVQLAEEQEDGTWQLIDGITVVVTDNDGNTITGTISIDPNTGDITFVPDDPLDVNETYTITVTIGDDTYQATVIIAVDDTNNEDSLFADVPMRTEGTYNIQDLLVNDRAFFGWIFGDPPQRFKMRLQNIDEGATVYLTAYGIYNIPGHENEIYYQRWSSSGEPVRDYEWSGFTIRVNEQDSSIDSGDQDYSFWATYFELVVMRGEENITELSNVQLIVELQ